MSINNGSVDTTIMSHLYREPVRVNELTRSMDQSRLMEVRAALSRLLRKALVMKITKDSTEPIYKLTRRGERVLERIVAQRFEHNVPMA